MTAFSGVAETLLIPLYAQYTDNTRPDTLLPDPKVLEIVERLKPDFSRITLETGTLVGIASRKQILDEVVRRFLDTHPDGVVVNLGAGLCTRYFRVDNGQVRWFNIDLPKVGRLWRQAFEPTDRLRFIPGSIVEDAWLDALPDDPATPILFVAEGVLMYLAEDHVRQVFTAIVSRYPNAEVVFEAMTPMIARQRRNSATRHTTARFAWGLASARELEGWDSRLRLAGQWYVLDRNVDRWGPAFAGLRNLPSVRESFSIVLIRFQRPDA
jgi:O-methyltransferase involved in polyketide biosynthesis